MREKEKRNKKFLSGFCVQLPGGGDQTESAEITASTLHRIVVMKSKMPPEFKRALSLLLGRYNSK